MQDRKIAIIGAGGHSREVTQALRQMGFKTNDLSYYVDRAFLDDESEKDILDIAFLGRTEMAEEIVIAVGESRLREKFAFQLSPDLPYFQLIHPLASVGEDVSLGLGAQVMQFCVITSNVTIGDFAIINIHTGIGHDCIVGDYFTASPRSNLTSRNVVGHHVFLGTGAFVLPGVSICDDVIIGAGAVVNRDITEPGTYVGMPARKIGYSDKGSS